MPYTASFTVGDSLPSVTIDGDRTQTFYTGETFRLTTTFEDDEDTPLLTRWEIIGSEHPTVYGNDFHSYLPSAGTYDVMVTAWDQWGNAAYDQITVEIVPPPYINTSHAITTNGVLGVGPQNKHHEKGGYVMLNIDHGLNLADISGFEIYVNYRRGVTQDEEKDRGGRLRWDKDTDTTSLVWADGAPEFRPALNFGVVSEYYGTQRLSEGYYDGKDAHGTQHLRPACALTNNDVYWQDQCGNEMTLSTVDDAFATGDFPGLGGCNSTHCRLRFHFLRSFGVDAIHQSNIDVAFRILTVDGPHLATDANPEGWLNHDMDMSIINRAVQLSITNTAMTETPSAPFFHIDSLVEDIGMHQTNIHSNYGVNYSITNACKRPLLYFLDEDFNIVHNEQYELNEHGAQNYYYFDARRRHVFDKAGIYYAMADCCEDCRPNGGSYDADMAVPPRSNVVQFVVLGDLDGDGIFDHEDPDKDNDGVCNKAEAVEALHGRTDAFPEESQWTDSDGDGGR